MKYKYLSVGIDAKTVKGQKKGYLTGILYLAPHTIASTKSLCPFSTPACRSVCLYSAGRGAVTNVQQARIRKTKEFQADSGLFMQALAEDILTLKKAAIQQGMTPVVRLNGTSDIEWENFGVIQQFPDLQFYDYLKHPPILRKNLPTNYHLTFSHSEHLKSWEWGDGWFERGVNTAVVFRGGMPALFRGRPVVDGDESDLRFLDPEGVFVGLKTKGQARPLGKANGFVVDYD